jgi:hypothetical protein
MKNLASRSMRTGMNGWVALHSQPFGGVEIRHSRRLKIIRLSQAGSIGS